MAGIVLTSSEQSFGHFSTNHVKVHFQQHILNWKVHSAHFPNNYDCSLVKNCITK